MKKSTLTALIAVPLIGAIAYTQFSGAGTGANDAGWAPPPTAVAAITVSETPLANTVDGIGTIEAAHQVDVASEVSGRVESIEFKSGQLVKKGDVLLRLNDEIDAAELVRLDARLKLAQKQYKRVSKLKGLAVSDSRIDEARSTLDEVRAEIASTKATLKKKIIVAPFDGVLGLRKIELGQYLNPGAVVVNITDLSAFNVNFTLPENVTRAVRVGQDVEMLVDALGEQPLTAVITTVEPQIQRGMHTLSIQGKVTTPPDDMRPGLFAKVLVDLGQDQNVILIPETAVQRTTFGNTVYKVVQGENGALSVEQASVETGRRADAQVVILSGLVVGDQVVVSGQNRLYFGAAITLKAPGEAVEMTPAPVASALNSGE